MAKKKLEPTVTIGGAPAGYKPATTLQPTVTIGGAPASYQPTATPNYITGENVPGVKTTPKVTEETKATKETISATPVIPNSGLNADEVQTLIKSYTSDVLNRMSQEEKTAERLSAYNILRMEFEQYGLGSLVTDIKNLLINDTPVSEFGLRLRGTDAYKDRFKANEARIAAGLSALSPAEYVALEDQYQNTQNLNLL